MQQRRFVYIRSDTCILSLVTWEVPTIEMTWELVDGTKIMLNKTLYASLQNYRPRSTMRGEGNESG